MIDNRYMSSDLWLGVMLLFSEMLQYLMIQICNQSYVCRSHDMFSKCVQAFGDENLLVLYSAAC